MSLVRVALVLSITVLGLAPYAIALPFSVQVEGLVTMAASEQTFFGASPGAGPLQQAHVAAGVPPTTVSSPEGTASAVLSMDARLGHLTGFAQTTGSAVDTGVPPGTVPGSIGANAFGSGNWSDTFTVISNSLPVGTLVPFLGTTSLESSVDLRTPRRALDETNIEVGARASWTVVRPGLPSQNVTLTNIVLIESGPLIVNKFLTDSILFFAAVGESFEVDGALSFVVQAHTHTGLGPSDRIVSIPNSATFFLDVATLDASYITASGLTYESPAATPEPTTLVLFGTTAAGLALHRWRKRSRPQ